VRRPPRAAVRLLSFLLPGERAGEILGDLEEAFARRLARGARPWSAGLWYWRQTLAVPARLRWAELAAVEPDLAELRRVLRSLARSPAYTLVAVTSLGLGIGATTAMSGTLRALLYAPLPVERPQDLRMVYHHRPDGVDVAQYGSSTVTDPQTGATVHSNFSYSLYRAMGEAVAGRAQVLGYAFVSEMSVAVGDRPALSAGGMLVSGDYFATLRVPTVLGRPLTTADDGPGAPPVAVIGHAFWQRAFGGDPDVVGSRLLLNGTSFEVVGVSGKGYVGLSPGGFFPPTDVTVPLSTHPTFLAFWMPPGGTLYTAEDRFWVRMMLRLPADGSGEPARQAMAAAFRQGLVDAGVATPAHAGDLDVRLLPGARGLDSLRTSTERPLLILSAVVGAVLLIACANLAGLLLARGASRRHEMAVRRAMGASRWRMVRPLALESAVLAALGGTLGLILAQWSGPLVTGALTVGLGRVSVEFGLDGAFVATAVAASAAAGALAVLLPAWRLARTDPGSHLTTRGQDGAGGRLTLGRGLVVAQIAVSIPLVVGAGLLLRTLGNLGRVDPGFDARGLVVFRVDPALVTTDPERRVQLWGQVLESLRELPGATSVSAVENVLISGWTSNTDVEIDGTQANLYMNAVAPGFFETMGVPVVSGRTIGPGDVAGSVPVAVVNETAERQAFGGRAVGRTLRVGGREMRVVGVVADTRYRTLRAEAPPTFFDPWVQRSQVYALHYVMRSDVPLPALELAVREAVARVDPRLPVTDLRSQSEEIRRSAARERVLARVLSVFAGFALLLACIGLHGITAFAVSRRTSEMGIRLALGAEPRGIVGLVLREVLALTGAGVALGLGAAYLLGPVVEAYLFGVAATDPLTTLGTAAAMAAVATVAAWLPAWRASRVDPMAALSPEPT